MSSITPDSVPLNKKNCENPAFPRVSGNFFLTPSLPDESSLFDSGTLGMLKSIFTDCCMALSCKDRKLFVTVIEMDDLRVWTLYNRHPHLVFNLLYECRDFSNNLPIKIMFENCVIDYDVPIENYYAKADIASPQKIDVLITLKYKRARPIET